jgi:hypothetical protein
LSRHYYTVYAESLGVGNSEGLRMGRILLYAAVAAIVVFGGNKVISELFIASGVNPPGIASATMAPLNKIGK